MEDIQKYHEDIIITKYGKPIAKLTAIEEEAPKLLFGFLKSSVVITGDFVKPTGVKWNIDE